MSTTQPTAPAPAMTVAEAQAELDEANALLTAALEEVVNLKATVKALKAKKDAAEALVNAGDDDYTLAVAQEATAEGEVTAAKAKVAKAETDLKNAQAAAQGN